MRGKFASSAATIVVGALFFAGEVAAATPAGAGVPEAPPLSCQTANFVVTLASTAAASCSSGTCTNYTYNVTSNTLNVDHTVIAVSASQDLNVAGTSTPLNVAALGVGDNVTGFLAGAVHEYAIRFNASGNKNVSWTVSVFGASNPRIGTVVIRSGSKTLEKCLIATPGIAGDVFQPAFQAQTALVAGGKCLVNLVFDGSGNVVDVNPVSGSTCIKYEGPVTVTIGTNTGPLKNNTSPHGLTFGNGTTTCYGPPRPSIPKCICTAAPCP